MRTALSMANSTDDRTISKRWLEQMSSCLTWKVVGPDISNPFQPPFALEALQLLVERREKLNEKIEIRCLADGFEVLAVKNYHRLDIQTDHPCLTKLSRSDLDSYLKESGVAGVINAHVDKIEEQLRQEVERLLSQQRPSMTSLRDRRKKKDRSKDEGYRVVKR